MAHHEGFRQPGAQPLGDTEESSQAWHGSDSDPVDCDSEPELEPEPEPDSEAEGEAVRCLTPRDSVGLDTLPEQLVDRRVRQGFRFNLLCVGETGLGKSTLVATLFNGPPDSTRVSHFCPAVGLRAETRELRESQVSLTLTVVSTVGFGDQVDREHSHRPIAAYIDAQFEAFLREELRAPRAPQGPQSDSRLHACLYFLAPTGHSLKALDLCTLRSLGSRVNVIPLVAKADTLSKAELQCFKARVMDELASQGVRIYHFPTDDEATARLNAAMNEQLPFAVVGSTDEVRMGGRLVRARQYCWGTVEVENEAHCDFVKLREMLVCTNMEDLREQTHARHYELYRRRRLRELGWAAAGPGPAGVDVAAARRRELQDVCRQKEWELKQALARRGEEKEAVLKQAKEQLQARFAHLERLQHRETLRLEEKRRALEEEMLAFSRKKAVSELSRGRMSASGTGKKRDDDSKYYFL